MNDRQKELDELFTNKPQMLKAGVIWLIGTDGLGHNELANWWARAHLMVGGIYLLSYVPCAEHHKRGGDDGANDGHRKEEQQHYVPVEAEWGQQILVHRVGVLQTATDHLSVHGQLHHRDDQAQSGPKHQQLAVVDEHPQANKDKQPDEFH
ncbi:hypothetical protein TYRP_019994 [Tyrophagus putrescentiae]|nr:hypothetical protein TYRP_019994 [Tyrophagus putrescentiae]